jgi:hypothetical protein
MKLGCWHQRWRMRAGWSKAWIETSLHKVLKSRRTWVIPARYPAVCIQEDVDGKDFRRLVDAYVWIINDEEGLRNLSKQIRDTMLHTKYHYRGKDAILKYQ